MKKILLLALLISGAAFAHKFDNTQIDSQTIETKYGTLYFEKEGKGPVIVLIAGGPGGSHASFHPTFSTLAEKFTLIYLDNIGRGRSARLPEGQEYTVERDVEDIEEIRKYLKVEKISIVGHSYGAMPALSYAQLYSQHTEKLVLASTPLDAKQWQSAIDENNRFLKSQYPDVLQKIAELRKTDDSTNKNKMSELNNILPDRTWANMENKRKRWRSNDPSDVNNEAVFISIAGRDSDIKLNGTIVNYKPLSLIGKLKSPILLCVGRYDYVTPPRISYELLSQLPTGLASIQVFEQSGHRPWVEESDLYISKISLFLRP